MRLIHTLVLALPILWACGSAQLILKSPIEERCGSAGLQGCPELTEGVLLFVEGKDADGKLKLEQAAAQNAPAKLRKFAKALRQLKKIPGTAQYMKPVNEVAKILASSKGDGSKGPAKAGGAPGAPGAPGVGPDDPDADLDLSEDGAVHPMR